MWIRRVFEIYKDAVWINPQPQSMWDYHESIRMTRDLIGDRMYPLTLDGLDHAMRQLSKGH